MTSALRKTVRARESARRLRLQGMALATFSNGLVLIDMSGNKPLPVKRAKAAKRAEQTFSLLKKLGQALERPGVARDSMFPTDGCVSFVYSVDPNDPSILVRTAADGMRERGRLVHGRFRASP